MTETIEVEVRNSLRSYLSEFVNECVTKGISFKDALKQVEMEFVMRVLERNKYNISKSAAELGINRNTLSKKITEFEQFERFRKHRSLFTS